MPLPLKKLRKIRGSFGVWEDASKGKGSHTTFLRRVEGCVYSYPIPTHNKEVLDCYVKGVRKRLSLSPDDGVSDQEFFGRG